MVIHKVRTEVLTEIINTMICICVSPRTIVEPVTQLTNMYRVCGLFDTVVVIIQHLSKKFLLIVNQQSCIYLKLFITAYKAV